MTINLGYGFSGQKPKTAFLYENNSAEWVIHILTLDSQSESLEAQCQHQPHLHVESHYAIQNSLFFCPDTYSFDVNWPPLTRRWICQICVFVNIYTLFTNLHVVITHYE
jgi:hypothetical protein